MTLPEARRLDFSEVPLVDIGALMAGVDDVEVVGAIHDACRDVGFMYVVNHGVSEHHFDAMCSASGEFFGQTMQEKMRLALNPRMRGYLPLMYRSYEGEARAATSHQEGFWMGEERPSDSKSPLDGPNVWPENIPALREAMQAYWRESSRLRLTLQRAFALALDLPGDFFNQFFEQSHTRLKINHYPPQLDDVTEHNIGVVPHSDSGGFTILWQDSNGGLEIQSKSGDWVAAPPVAESFIINLGNIMQMWTNGYFSSTPHRVVNRNSVDRYSIPLFVNPNNDAVIKPLRGDRHSFEPFRYGDYQRQSWQRAFPVARIP